MRLFFIFGCILIAAAFLSGATEMAMRVMYRRGALAYSAIDVWRMVSPQGLGHARSYVEAVFWPALWNPVLTTVLILPGWLIFGVPGVALVWLCHPRVKGGAKIDEDSLFLYDRLAKQAREDGYHDDGPMNEIPSHPMEKDATPAPFAASLPANENDEEEDEEEYKGEDKEPL
ncbi:MAG TPA: hypothetical protein ENI55_03515 [Alphaproteobacteria bacterium]|nr:hypothetical protein [Alphaproteobacteria bacterium]